MINTLNFEEYENIKNLLSEKYEDFNIRELVESKEHNGWFLRSMISEDGTDFIQAISAWEIYKNSAGENIMENVNIWIAPECEDTNFFEVILRNDIEDAPNEINAIRFIANSDTLDAVVNAGMEKISNGRLLASGKRSRIICAKFL